MPCAPSEDSGQTGQSKTSQSDLTIPCPQSRAKYIWFTSNAPFTGLTSRQILVFAEPTDQLVQVILSYKACCVLEINPLLRTGSNEEDIYCPDIIEKLLTVT